jgi:arylsulfatase A-like enzyme
MTNKLTTNKQPNIVLIMTDQQRTDTIAALGNPHMRTPNLDRLVQEGVSFDQCYVTAPCCAPSRASFFTGLYPHTNGVYKNADLWRHSWVEKLADAGYHCANIGKMHTFPYETPMGFHERFVVENKDRYLEGRYFLDRWDMFLQAQGLTKQQRELYRLRDDYKESLGAFDWELPEHTQSDKFVGNTAAWWIRNKPVDQPLFLQIGFPGPHPPFDPPRRYAEEYLDKKLPLPQVTREELDGQPAALKELRVHHAEIDHDSIYWLEDPTDEQLHRMRAYYYANVTLIDELVGGIIEALEEKGKLDDTVIIFTSDHGEALGDHGLIQKWNMYDVATRVPMIVWAPGRFAGNRRFDGQIQHFDVVPAIMELAGIDVPASWATRSVMPALEGEEWSGRQYVFAEQSRDGILTGTAQMTMIRDGEWKLVHYLEDEDGELYHLANDPDEVRNLWNEPAAASVKERLTRELLRWSLRSSLDAARWSEEWR